MTKFALERLTKGLKPNQKKRVLLNLCEDPQIHPNTLREIDKVMAKLGQDHAEKKAIYYAASHWIDKDKLFIAAKLYHESGQHAEGATHFKQWRKTRRGNAEKLLQAEKLLLRKGISQAEKDGNAKKASRLKAMLERLLNSP